MLEAPGRGWMDSSTPGRSKKQILYLLALLEELRTTTETQIERSHTLGPTRRQRLEKLIRNDLETETHNPIWRVAIFPAITAIDNQRFLD